MATLSEKLQAVQWSILESEHWGKVIVQALRELEEDLIATMRVCDRGVTWAADADAPKPWLGPHRDLNSVSTSADNVVVQPRRSEMLHGRPVHSRDDMREAVAPLPPESTLCTCGASKVKDSTHADWCTVKRMQSGSDQLRGDT